MTNTPTQRIILNMLGAETAYRVIVIKSSAVQCCCLVTFARSKLPH